MNETTSHSQFHPIQGKVVYLLALVALLQFIYPITANGSTLTTIIYQLLYFSLIIVGIVLGRDSRRHVLILAGSGLAFLLSGVLYALNDQATWALLLTYGTILPFQILVILMLMRFIFATRAVNRDVIYAAIAVYLLLGAVFVPVYGIIETLAPGAYVDTMVPSGQLLPWQHFLYYSYATLTTLGYGDVLPASMWARSAASLEAVLGVIYLTVIMARLVGLYAQERHDPSAL